MGRSPMVPCSRSDGGISLLIRNKGVQGERNLPNKLHRNLDRSQLRGILQFWEDAFERPFNQSIGLTTLKMVFEGPLFDIGAFLFKVRTS